MSMIQFRNVPGHEDKAMMVKIHEWKHRRLMKRPFIVPRWRPPINTVVYPDGDVMVVEQHMTQGFGPMR